VRRSSSTAGVASLSITPLISRTGCIPVRPNPAVQPPVVCQAQSARSPASAGDFVAPCSFPRCTERYYSMDHRLNFECRHHCVAVAGPTTERRCRHLIADRQQHAVADRTALVAAEELDLGADGRSRSALYPSSPARRAGTRQADEDDIDSVALDRCGKLCLDRALADSAMPARRACPLRDWQGPPPSCSSVAGACRSSALLRVLGQNKMAISRRERP
jgi:hypothetical protein